MYINIFVFIYLDTYIYICIDYVGNDLVLFALKHGLVLSLLVRSQNAEEVGRINYVPITAVQRFDMEKKFIRNGVLWRKCHFWQQLGGVDLKTKLVLKTSWGTIGFTSFRMCDRNLVLHCLFSVHRCLLWLLVLCPFLYGYTLLYVFHSRSWDSLH